VLHRLAGLDLAAHEIASVLKKARVWRRPKPQKYRGKVRPSSALVLSTEERREYRRNHFGVEE